LFCFSFLFAANVTAKVFSQPSSGLGGVFDRTAQRLAAKQQNHNDDDEQEADRAAANIEGIGKNRRE
jgi:hypothetical protein